MRRSLHSLSVIVLATIALCVTGCGATSRGNAVPNELQDSAVVSGMGPEIRTWGIAMNPAFNEPVMKSVGREREDLARRGHTGPLPAAEYLAISGGGSNGAYGAGMLCAWTDAGNRPAFKVVTGISTGALTAPFVFAGPKYDHVLRDLYTTTRTGDILIERSLLEGFTGDALADTSPLWKLLEKQVNQELMDDIAAEYRKGRLLVIGTTNLDAGRAVLWNIGEIAASGKPGANELIRKILIASAAIPGAFPPVFIDVEANAEKYQEMHVDGGAMTQVFLYPPSMNLKKDAEAAGIFRDRRAFIIRNARLDPHWAQVDRKTMSIAGRAISSLIQTQGLGDLYRIYLNCQRDGIDYNLAYIPSTFTVESKEAFDPVYMEALFKAGYEQAKNGYPWLKAPPAYEQANLDGVK